MERKYNRGPVISGFTWRPLVVPSVAPNTASTPMLYESLHHQFDRISSKPSINVASSRLPSRRFSLPSPWIWFGNPESLCSVSPQTWSSSHKRQWQYYTMLRYSHVLTTSTYLREDQEKRSGQCRGNSSRFFRPSRCKFNGRQAGTTATTSYLDMYV